MTRSTKLTIMTLIMAIALIVTGCGQKPEDNKPNNGKQPGEETELGGTNGPNGSDEPGNESEDVEEEYSPTTIYSKDTNPVVTIEMDNGDIIKVELYPEVAPNTVNNFISLVNKGYYDGVIFHRVIEGFMIQGGDPTGTGMGGPGYKIKAEFSDSGFINDLEHLRGVISMARQGSPDPANPSLGYDTAGSQFFIMHEDNQFLDAQYTGFGKVVSGIEVVDSIAETATGAADKPIAEQKMKKVTVDTFGVTYDEPEIITE